MKYVLYLVLVALSFAAQAKPVVSTSVAEPHGYSMMLASFALLCYLVARRLK